MPSADDERVGRLLRAIRRRTGLTQLALSLRAGVPRSDVIMIEGGDVGLLPLDRTRAIFDALGGRARLATFWNGAVADRLLDEAHARIVERALAVLQARDWQTAVEVSFSEYGERGSIDILGAHRGSSAIAVCEVKSEFGSLEETNRVLDMKVRLAPGIAERVFAFRPRTIGRVLILPDRSTLRRVVAEHARTMGAIYPARGREVRRWLRDPSGPLRGIWFLSEVALRDSDSRF
jgi:transcriptional regulator with XRE-family HTH domain